MLWLNWNVRNIWSLFWHRPIFNSQRFFVQKLTKKKLCPTSRMNDWSEKMIATTGKAYSLNLINRRWRLCVKLLTQLTHFRSAPIDSLDFSSYFSTFSLLFMFLAFYVFTLFDPLPIFRSASTAVRHESDADTLLTSALNDRLESQRACCIWLRHLKHSILTQQLVNFFHRVCRFWTVECVER